MSDSFWVFGLFLNADQHRISRCSWFFALRKAKNARFFFNKGKCKDGHLEKERLCRYIEMQDGALS